MLRYENGFEVTLVNTLGIWYALVGQDGNHWFECSFKSKDRDKMVEYADTLIGTLGLQRIN